ncbi:MAG: hypothetical protein MAG715_01301 [Methanonatronarchaeales archaeon]|nr:hypothetical protein [Methanonatronarchaeales archaeon]
MNPESRAREKIDRQLESSGWTVQDRDRINLGASPGVAVREFPTGSGPVDYALFVDRQAVGVVEAKPEETTLSGVAEQTRRYAAGIPEEIPHVELPLRFRYESTGVETMFTDAADPEPRQRRVFSFHRPETLEERTDQLETLRGRLRNMPGLGQGRLWDAQYEAITNLERSFAENRPRALVQMATGSGKTYTAVTETYRLLKHAKANRVLFLVDRNNLGRQAKKEFEQYRTPDSNRKFTELYNVQHLTTNALDDSSDVCISTVQRLYSILKDEDLDPEVDEESGFEHASDGEPAEVVYNPEVPVETFDFIVIDECHRSIYGKWRQVLEYFDAFLVGLTATPAKRTLGFFDKNLVMEYSHERAVADNVNVDYDVYRIVTEISEEGGEVEAEQYIGKRDKRTREELWETLDEDLDYSSTQLDRYVVAPDQIRTVVRAFRDAVTTEMFPGRAEVPKTIVFAKDDSHAEDITRIVREEFGKGNDFCKKITYRSEKDPEDLISEFRNSYNPRVAVAVDMISTGTDIKPVECLLFMRNIASRTYFEQMKGRGTRTVDPNELRGVTPDAARKTHFVVVDAVGVTETEKTDSRQLNREPSVSFERVVKDVSVGIRDDDTLSTLASRLSRFDKTMDPAQREELREKTGEDVRDITNDLLDAADPDVQEEVARQRFDTEEPTEEQVEEAREEVKSKTYQYIDEESIDEVRERGFEYGERAERVVQGFREFIEENRDEITALQIFYSRPYGDRHLTLDQIRELAEAIESPPYTIHPDELWDAYERLQDSRERGASHRVLLTDLVSILRYELGETDELHHFRDDVDQRFRDWMERQEGENGREFTGEQREFLNMMKDHIATSLTMELDDFQLSPFNEKGGLVKARNLFGNDLENVVDELNEELVA